MDTLRGLGVLAGLAVALACSPGNSAEWETVTLDCKVTAASVLVAEKGQVTPTGKVDAMVLTFTGFDEKNGRAMMVGNQGSSPLLFF